MSAIQHLFLFDIDGTLMLAHGLGRAAKRLAMLDVFGTDAGVLDYPFGGKTDWQILTEILADHGYTREKIGALMPDYERLFTGYMRELVPEYPAKVLPGAMELVEALRQREDVLLGIVTGNTASTAPIKLEAAGFDPAWFPVGAYGSESANRNDLPPLALQRAIAHAGHELRPAQTLVIGDTVADVRAARHLGGVAVAVKTGFEDLDKLIAAEPDYLLDDLTQFNAQVPLNKSL